MKSDITCVPADDLPSARASAASAPPIGGRSEGEFRPSGGAQVVLWTSSTLSTSSMRWQRPLRLVGMFLSMMEFTYQIAGLWTGQDEDCT